jgi:DNA-directed RNA polymerase alpha subunit
MNSNERAIPTAESLCDELKTAQINFKKLSTILYDVQKPYEAANRSLEQFVESRDPLSIGSIFDLKYVEEFRICRSLKKNGIETILDLLQYSDLDLLKIEGIDDNSISKIKLALERKLQPKTLSLEELSHKLKVAKIAYSHALQNWIQAKDDLEQLERKSKLDKDSIEFLFLDSDRITLGIVNKLNQFGITTISDLCNRSRKELTQFRGLGDGTILRIIAELKNLDKSLKS